MDNLTANPLHEPKLVIRSAEPTTVVVQPGGTGASSISIVLNVSNGKIMTTKASAGKKAAFTAFWATNSTYITGIIATMVVVLVLGVGLGVGLSKNDDVTVTNEATAPVYKKLAIDYNVSDLNGPFNNTVVSVLRCTLSIATNVDPDRVVLSSWTERDGTIIMNETSLDVLNNDNLDCANTGSTAETTAFLQAQASAITLPIDPISIGIEMLVDITDPTEPINTVVDAAYFTLGADKVAVSLIEENPSSNNVTLTPLYPSATPSVSASPSNSGTASSTPSAANNNNPWSQKGPGANPWNGLTTSDNGTIIYSAAPGLALQISTDGGNTWSSTSTSATESWQDVACDAMCTTVAAVTRNGKIWVSKDSGSTFNPYGSTLNYEGVSVSDDGNTIVAVADKAYISTSSNTPSFNAVGATADYTDVSTSSNGQIIVLVANNSQIIISTNGGTSFISTGTSQTWVHISMASDASVIYAAADGFGIVKSTDHGTTWNLTSAPSGTFSSITCSNDGRRVLVAYTDRLRISEDYGTTFGTIDTTRLWSTVAMSGDGLIMFGNVDGGYIYVAPPVAPSISPSASTTPAATVSSSPSTSISNTPTSSRTPSNTPSQTPSSSRTPSNTPSQTPSSSRTPSNTPSQTPTPTNTPSNTPSPTSSSSPSPSYQPYTQLSPSVGSLQRYACDPNITLCVGIYPISLAWAVVYSQTSRLIIDNYGVPFPGSSHYWAVIPDSNSNRIFAIPRSGNPQSGIHGQNSATAAYTSMTSTSWEQFDVAMTSSTTFIMAATDNGPNIQYTNNSGASAYTFAVGRNMRAIDMTPDGSTIVVGESNTDGKAFISTDNATTFTLLMNAPQGPYKRIVMSDNGNIMYVNIDNSSNPLHFSNNAGINWSSVGMNSTVNDISCTADGSYLFIQGTDYVYGFDLNTGILSLEIGPINAVATNRIAGAMSADGKRRISIGGGLWMFVAGIPPSPSATPTISTTSTGTATGSNSPTPSTTATASPTPSETPTISETASITPSASSTPSNTPSTTSTFSTGASQSPTNTPSNTRTPSQTPSISSSPSSKRNWFSVAISRDSSLWAAADQTGNNGYVYLSYNNGTTWVRNTNAGARIWGTVSLSANRSCIVAAGWGTYIYRSTDYGQSWSALEAQRNWWVVKTSADCKYIYGLADGYSYLVVSRNGGSSFASVAHGSSSYGRGLSISYNGTIIALGLANALQSSTDAGASLTTRYSSEHGSTFVSRDGSQMLAVVINGYLKLSRNFGFSWSDVTSAGSRGWSYVTGSGNFSILYATVTNGPIYRSFDAGISWNAVGPTKGWVFITCSEDGSMLLATPAFWTLEYVYRSLDYGVTWSAI